MLGYQHKPKRPGDLSSTDRAARLIFVGRSIERSVLVIVLDARLISSGLSEFAKEKAAEKEHCPEADAKQKVQQTLGFAGRQAQ